MRRWIVAGLMALAAATPAKAETIRVELGPIAGKEAWDGRVILIVSKDGSSEPRSQVDRTYASAQIFGQDANALAAGQSVTFDAETLGYPLRSAREIAAGRYHVQAVLHRYDTFKLGNGKVVKLPAARGGGQNWKIEPGNLTSTPVEVSYDPARAGEIRIVLDRINPPIAEPKDSEFIRHFRFRSERLSRFWGRDVFIRGHVLVPKDFDRHPEARYPLMVFHGHYPADFSGFRTTPPDPAMPCVPAPRFNLPCYNRTEQQEAYDFYRRWVSPDFPRFLIVEIDHSNPYFDDSYAVNSENLGPYGDAISLDFIPALEKKFRGLGQGWSRFLYGGSTGGWEALAVQVKYPDLYNGAFAACPDSVDFRQFKTINIYDDANFFWREGPFGRVERPVGRNWLGHVSHTAEQESRYERVIGTKSRSGAQWDIFEAVFSPMGDDGYPKPLWDRTTGLIDKSLLPYWRENYDLRHILERDWATLGPKLQGKIHIYVGDMDNFYLNNAVYLMEDFLKRADPPYGGEVAYGDRAEHCWNGDPTQPNAISRLRYNSFYVPKIMARIAASAPPGADLTSWRYR